MGVASFTQLAIAASLPVIVCVLLSLIRHRTGASRLSEPVWQVIAGVVFGLIAIAGTEMSTSVDGFTMNVRNASPLAAGLFIGGPAGVISGIIGAVERWLSVSWGASEFTSLAGSISCVFAGAYAALLRRFLFDDRMPSWPMAIATGVVAEVMHLLLVFLTNLDQGVRAFEIAWVSTFPMIGFVSAAMGITAIILSLLNGRPLITPSGSRGVAQIVQNHLLVGVAIAFFFTVGFTAMLQTNLSRTDTQSLLRLNIADVKQSIVDASDANILDLTKRAAGAIRKSETATSEECVRLADELDVAEIDVIDRNGIIVASNFPEFINFDMSSGEQAREFLVLLPGTNQTQYVQSYQPTSYDANTLRKYAGVSLEDGFVQVGYDAKNFLDDLTTQVEASVKNRHVGQTGALVVVDESGKIISTRTDVAGLSGDELVADASAVEADQVFSTTFTRKDYYASYEEVEGYRIIAMLPKAEANFSRDLAVLIMSYMEVLVFAALFLVIYFAIKRVVVRNIWQVNGRLGQITNGDLDVEVDVRGTTEFASLSDDINQTVGALKNSIALVQADLDMAADIQSNSLPTITPEIAAYPEFDLFASMEPAKEVGGDFYDFFLVDHDHLAMVVADVSGKGVPAALFMMQSKTVIKMEANSGIDPDQVLLAANSALTEKNDDDMFTTAWIGVLELSTGTLVYADAGHEKLALYRNGTWELPPKPNSAVALGVFNLEEYRALPDRFHFRTHTIVLQPGDILLQYTDGVTEATNAEEELFGEERLLDALNEAGNANPETLLPFIREKVAEFVQDAPQFDDITLLGLRYNGTEK